MAEYITKESAIEAFENGEADVIEDYGDGADFGFGLKNIKSTINAIPSADVVPVVHGRWVPFHSEAAGDIQYCSACEIGNAAKSDFCPHCGAIMDGGVADG